MNHRALPLALLVVLAAACETPPPVTPPGPIDAARAGVHVAAADDGAPEPGRAVPVTSADPQQGSALAPVTLVVWGDFQCPFTARMMKTLVELQASYGEQLRVVWKHNPLPFHKDAPAAHLAAETVLHLGGQAAFWKFHALAFANQRSLVEESFVGWAGAAGVDKDAFLDAYREKRFQRKIDDDIAKGKEAGVTGTPASFINGVFVSGAQPIEKLREVVDAQLAAARALEQAGTPRRLVYAELSDKNHAAKPPSAAHTTPKPPADSTTVWRVPIGRSPVRGKADAPVTLVMFFDFQCPFSLRARATIAELMAQNEGKIRLVAKHHPLPFHDRAEPASELALEARAQRGDAAFWKAFDTLFGDAAHLSDQELEGDAKTLGLDPTRAMAAVHGRKHAAELRVDDDLADDLAASGTPHFFINGRRLVGAQPLARFQEMVDEEVAHASALVKSGTPASRVYDAIMKGARADDIERVVVPAPTKAQPSKGAPGAKVVVQVFSDLQCPYCKRVMPTIDELLAAYPGRVRVVWRNHPLPFHKDARLAAEAALEAFAQKGNDAFWKMQAKLYEDQGPGNAGLGRVQLDVRARELGLDMKRFDAALDQGTHRAEIDLDEEIASRAGLTGTPAFAVNDYFVSGAQPLTVFRRRVEKALGPHEPIPAGALHVDRAKHHAAAPQAPSPSGVTPAKLGAKHLLIMYVGSMRAPANVTRSKQEALKLATDVARMAHSGIPFEDLVRKFSDEPGAAARGGDLGTFPRAAMVPEFTRGVEALKVGETSNVVETSFGYHVIVRTQ